MAGKPSEFKAKRRQLLTGMAAGAGSALVQNASANTKPDSSHAIQTPEDPTRVQGPGVSKVGKRSPFEKPERMPYMQTLSVTPLQDLHGTITPSDLHFERHHAGVPLIDPDNYALLIHGMVDRPLKFTLNDLKRFPAITRTCFIECSGNLNIDAGEKTSPQTLCGLTSQSEWTGVALSTLFREVGVSPKASWFLAEGSDAAVMARSIPVDKAWGDAIIAYAQNGEAIRPEQGYPARLLLPGWEGNTSVKWLRRMELADHPFMTREETSKYSDPLRNSTARLFSVVMDARSVITFPSYPSQIEKGWLEIRGLAWSGRGLIAGVDISTDAGKSWQAARLAGPVLPKAHTRFMLPWQWDGHETEIMSRAADETGYVQPTRKQLIDVRGPGSVPYHLNPITAWRIKSDGEVLYRAEPWA